MNRPVFGEVHIEKPVRMAYIGVHPTCGHVLNAMVDDRPDASKEAASWALDGLLVTRVTSEEAREGLMRGDCAVCQPPDQLTLL